MTDATASKTAPIVSDFDQGLDGWTLDGGTATHALEGANGYFRALDTDDGQMVMTAPETFTGDLSFYSGGVFSFDAVEWINPDQGWQVFGTVTLSGGGVTLSQDIASGWLGDSWTNYAVALTAEAWGVDTETWDALMQDVTEMRVVVESGAEISETVGIDTIFVSRAPFTQDGDAVNFNKMAANTYHASLLYNGMDGDDQVRLPRTEIQAERSGFVVGSAFYAGDGNDTVYGGKLDDVIYGGNGNDALRC